MWRPNKRELSIILLIFTIAYLIRGIPSWFNWGWGNDFGIYYGLTESLIDDPQLFKPYTGWGDTYHYFPIFFIIMAGLNYITGIEVEILLRVVSPIIGSLSVVLFYFLVKGLHPGKYIPLLAAFLLALNPFHAYQTAHAAPLTIAHLFMVLSLLLFLRKDNKPWMTHALYISSILLIMSHHLTTFIYIVIIIGIFVFRSLHSKERPETFWSDYIYILFFTGLTFAYWAFIATPVFNFMRGGLYLAPLAIVALFYILLVLMAVAFEIKYRRGYEYKPIKFSELTEKRLMVIVIGLLIAFTVIFTFYDFGTGFKFLPIGVVLLIPTFIISSLAIVGVNRIHTLLHCLEIKGIFYSIAGTLLFSIITWNSVILPFRLIEYLAYPLAILCALGFIWLIGLKEDVDWKDMTPRIKTTFTIFLTIILISGATTYAVQRTTSGFEESISTQVAAAIEYLEGNATANGTVASDHRISNILWQAGFNATYDDAYDLWFSPAWNNAGCLSELEGNGTTRYYGRVDYLVVDSVMIRDGVQSNINETPRMVNNTFYEKFNNEPFELVFEAASLNNYTGAVYVGYLSKPLPVALNWCRVYRVNWTYIDGNVKR
jgi:hypothetical protein